MKIESINKFINHCNKVKELGITYADYEALHVYKNYFSTTVAKIKAMEPTDLTKKAVDLYESNKKCNRKAETDDVAEISYERDSEGKILYYTYTIYRRDKSPLVGKLNREEMNLIHRLYSYYGDSITQREIVRQFPELSLIEFRRILRAFNITKASSPFAPHMFEELSQEELLVMQMREKENSFQRSIELEQVKNNEKLLRKYALENIELKKQLEENSKFTIKIPENVKPTQFNEPKPSNQDLVLYISDMHIGASLNSGALFTENVNYGEAEVRRRLEQILLRIRSMGRFNNIILNLMGDNIDCCGQDGRTSRLDHYMPENMDARQQANTYIDIMMWFIETIIINDMCNEIKVYSVPCGNHDGNFGYMTTKALLAMISKKFPFIYTEMFEQFYGVYEFNNHKFVICHGKDCQHMKKGFPLNCDDKTKVMIYEWLDVNGISGNNIHIVKGDLHSNNLNSCKKFDYRNVLSLFGASDYSNYNFSANSYGMSYDMFVGNNFVRGTFENV